VTDLADHVVRRHPRALEPQLSGMGIGHRPLDPTDAVLLARHHEGSDAACGPLLGVRDGEDHGERGAVAVGDVVLHPVEHPLVAVAYGAGADRLRVTARLGLGEREAGCLLGAHDGLDVGRPEVPGHAQQGRRRSRGARWPQGGHREADSAAGGVLDEQRSAQRRQSPAADVLRHVGRPEAAAAERRRTSCAASRSRSRSGAGEANSAATASSTGRTSRSTNVRNEARSSVSSDGTEKSMAGVCSVEHRGRPAEVQRRVGATGPRIALAQSARMGAGV
jgi:hypothetical protein